MSILDKEAVGRTNVCMLRTIVVLSRQYILVYRNTDLRLQVLRGCTTVRELRNSDLSIMAECISGEHQLLGHTDVRDR